MSTKFCFKVPIAAVLTAVLFGCGTEMSPRYYAATGAMVLKPDTPPPADVVERTMPDAGALLHKGDLFIGFVPPPLCRNSASAGGGPSAGDDLRCQTLMAALETTAGDRGYRVLNWVQLLGDPYRTAADRNVDLLFVVEELAVHRQSGGKYEISDIKFAELKDADTKEPYRMANALAVGARCKSEFSELNKPTKAEESRVLGVTITLKMVSVRDGVSQWFYRHSAAHETKEIPEKKEADLFYISRGQKKRGISKIVVGTVFTGIGIATAVVGSRLNRYGTSFSTRNAGVGLAWASILPFAIALPITTVGIYREAKPAEYEPPEKVVCRSEPLSGNPFSVQGAADENAAVSMSLSNETSKEKTDSKPESNDTVLIEELVTHFYTELNELIRSSEPPKEPTPTEATAPDAPPETVAPNPTAANPTGPATPPAQPSPSKAEAKKPSSSPTEFKSWDATDNPY